MKKLIKYLKQYKKYAIITPFFVFFEAVLDVILPFLLSKIIDNGIALKDFNYVLKIGGIMLLASSLSMVLAISAGRSSAIAGVGFAKNIRIALFKKIQSFSFANTDKFNTATLMSRVTNDAGNASTTLMMSLRILVRAPILLIFATGFAFGTNRALSIVFFISLPILAIILRLILHIAHPKFIAMLKWYDKLTQSIQETLVGVREVKVFVREDHQKKGFLNISKKLREMSLKAEKVILLENPIMQIVLYACIIAVLWFGGQFVITEKMSIGELVSFIQYINQALIAVMMISFATIQIVVSRASVDRIVEVLDEEIDIDPNINSIIEPKDGSIEFKNISFSYGKEDKFVFENMNLKIKSGETIGILGATGTGKSSLVQLIPRLYDVADGEVFVGGNNVKDYSLVNLRDSVAMVLQKNILFSGTILENLKWGDKNATQEEIEEACKIAEAHDFVLNQPKGYETYLEQGGTNLSGGQKQRLTIARALLKKPKIIILDDSTSAVDTTTDANIKKGFRENLKGTTTIIIAQRISSIKDANRIIVLDNNGISDIGNHDFLLKNNDFYKEIYQLQQKEVDEIEE